MFLMFLMFLATTTPHFLKHTTNWKDQRHCLRLESTTAFEVLIGAFEVNAGRSTPHMAKLLINGTRPDKTGGFDTHESAMRRRVFDQLSRLAPLGHLKGA